MLKKLEVIKLILLLAVSQCFAQDITLKLLNSEIPKSGKFILEYELSNNTCKDLLLPINPHQFSSYYFKDNELVKEDSSVYQNIICVVPKDTVKNTFYEHWVFYPQQSDTIQNIINNVASEAADAAIIDFYKSKGCKESDVYILELNYLFQNLLLIQANTKKTMSYPFDLSSFNSGDIENPVLDGYTITGKSSRLVLELNLQPEFLKPYFDRMKSLGILKDTVYLQPLLSNGVPIK